MNKKPWLWIVVLVALAAATYLPSFRGGFVNDDRMLVQDRAFLFSAPEAYRILPFKVYWWGTPYDADAWRYYRPWVSLTYWFEYQVGGLDAGFFHFSNWIVHLANTALVFLLMRMLVGNGAALAIAALVGVCPTGLTSVGWISGRTDLWATFFVLLFLLAFRAAKRTENRWPHIASSAAFLGALASKEVAIVAPIIAWALDRYSKNANDSQGSPRRPPWHYALLAIPLAIYFILRLVASGEAIPTSTSVGTVLHELPYLSEQYLRVGLSMLLPLHYNFFTDLTWSVPGMRGEAFLLSWLLFLAIIGLIIWGLRRRRLWAVGGLWFGVALFPAYGLNRPFAPIADFYAYMALPGFWLFIIEGLRALGSTLLRRREIIDRGLAGIVPIVLIIFAVLTFHRLPILRSDLTLWSHMAKRYPSSDFVATNLSEAYHKQGDDERAFRWLMRAAALDSTNWVIRVNLANYYLDREDVIGAIPHVDALAELAPDRYKAQVTIARFYYVAEFCSAAVETYRKAFQLGPPTPDAVFGFGNALFCIEQYQDAVEVYKTALILNFNNAAVYNNIGICYENLGEFDQAIEAHEEALRLDSTMILSRESLAILYLDKGDTAGARRAAEDFMAHHPPPERVYSLSAHFAQAGMDTTVFWREK
jgi:tetratricopeptide (TPR) repeat protein